MCKIACLDAISMNLCPNTITDADMVKVISVLSQDIVTTKDV